MNGLGVVLETARRANGLTQQQLAEAVGIRQAALSRYENETREPDDDALARIADVLGLTPDFLRHASKIRGAVAVDAHMRRRKTAKPSDWRRLEAQLNVYRLHARRLFEDIAVRTEERLPNFDPLETDPSSAARLVRMQWHMPTGPVRSLVQWLEAAGCIVIEEDFHTRGIDGLSQWIDECPVILLNINLPTDRKRLTLAHELGHLCLHSRDINEDIEDEANSFAAEFLMPWESIRPQLRNLTMAKLLDLKREWGVSMQALIERAWLGKLITYSQRTNFYKALSAHGWRTSEPVSEELAPEAPALAQNIGNALVSNGLTLAEIADLVGVSGDDSTNPFLPRKKRLRVVDSLLIGP
jgi:Zn-dependent peptidase ImmA (M78 family)/DNA-binding XRE family transcriptional regulator